MLTIPAGKTSRYCDGRSRRDFLQIGMAGLGSVGLSSLLRAKAAAKEGGASSKDTSVILLWLDGGVSQHDTYDPKPTAPPEYRGIWGAQSTNVPGTQISEMFPLQAKIADKFSILRSMHHNNGDHFAGGHHMLTGRGGASGADRTAKFPFFGAIATKVLGSRQTGLPANVAIPSAMSIGLRPGFFGGHYLGAENDPFDVGSDPSRDNFRVKNLSLDSSVTIDRLADRRNLLNQFDKLRRDVDNRGSLDAIDEFDRQAYHMVTDDRAQKAFDIAAEDDKMRDRYGRHSWGQSALLARRLVEAGSTFVTCHFGGWDSHWNHEGRMHTTLPQVDQIVSALITDLEDRGRLDSTMVIVMSEFGRTPKMNDGGNGGPPLSKGTPGRDHWGNAMSVLVAGGGIQGGQVVGSTNRLGETPLDRPLRPGDLHHTVFKVLGVDPNLHFNDMAGRPIIAIDHGDVIDELF
ncbi:DUF1501 domain-containing protein [Lignipirellula cremea]|uniref:DUF1501 domain-containing protein n=1 Tax=Lignipirellula cremea TaxID=2528010 RepID=A0A518DSH1_9BACT|nr:DUF1501 domain-containing protein [Lignipirellula cremea]QDU94790.1 hypothetical protein Pla8534_25970 [Lignipirellula cremea]